MVAVIPLYFFFGAEKFESLLPASGISGQPGSGVSGATFSDFFDARKIILLKNQPKKNPVISTRNP